MGCLDRPSVFGSSSNSSANGRGSGLAHGHPRGRLLDPSNAQTGHSCLDGCYIRHLPDSPPDQRNACRFERVPFSSVGVPTIRPEMTGVVELDCSDNARVRFCDQEIQRELANPVPYGTIALAPLESQHPRQLYLGQHTILWQRFHQASVEHLFRLAEERWSRLERPWPVAPMSCWPARPCQCGGGNKRGYRRDPKYIGRHTSGSGGSPNPPSRIDPIANVARELGIKARSYPRIPGSTPAASPSESLAKQPTTTTSFSLVATAKPDCRRFGAARRGNDSGTGRDIALRAHSGLIVRSFCNTKT